MITFRVPESKRVGAWHSDRLIGIVAFCCLLFGATSASAGGLLDKTIKVDISDNTPLEDALIEWGIDAGVTVMINTAKVGDRVAPAVHATLSARKALLLLLRGSGMSYKEDNGRIQIIPEESLVQSGLWSDSSEVAFASDNNTTNQTTTGAQSDEDSRRELSEVIVTAQKREERLQDVPVPVTAIDADSLVDANQFRIQDYFSSVPGLSVATIGNGYEQLAIRGITTGGNTNPTVAVLIDDVPVSPSSAVTDNASFIPDVDPSDLARVEVLRGPQGTLYGADGLGGLVKYVTADPSTDRISGRIQADLTHPVNGDGPGYAGRGLINVPITDTLAVRASGYWRKDAGYIDDATLGNAGVNQVNAFGGRFSAMWRPSDSFSIKLNAMLQETFGRGNTGIEPELGEFQQLSIRGTGGWNSEIHFFDATIKAKFAGIDFTSVTGYITNAGSQTGDYSQAGLDPNTALYNWSKTQKFTQEIRLNSSVSQYFDWLVGGFFSHEHSPTNQILYDENLATGSAIPGDRLIDFNFPLVITEYAGFADATVHFTDKLDLQFGGREGFNRQTFRQTDVGPDTILFDGIPSPAVLGSTDDRDSTFTYLISPSFKFSRDLMVYARIATGYRPGGPNSDARLLGAPAQFQADKTRNYEIGAKGNLFDHLLTFDSSVYYIDWKNIQISVFNSEEATFFANAGNAKSEGVELSQTIQPVHGLRIEAWEVWNEAVLTSAFPQTIQFASPAFGEPGDSLPYSSRWSGNFAVTQDFPIGTMTGYVHPWVSYVGQRWDAFSSTEATRNILPSYVEVSLLVGARYEGWKVDLSVRNLTDKRGVLEDGFYNPSDPASRYLNYIDPRTVGLSCAYSF
jgi:iron complex outermembrane recepter protein